MLRSEAQKVKFIRQVKDNMICSLGGDQLDFGVAHITAQPGGGGESRRLSSEAGETKIGQDPKSK